MPTRGTRKRTLASPAAKTQPKPTQHRTSKRLTQKKTTGPAISRLSSDDSDADEEEDDEDEDEVDQEDDEEDKQPKTPPIKRTRITRKKQIDLPIKPSRFDKPQNPSDIDPHRVTLQNYKECDLDEAAIDELLADKDRKTSNWIPTNIQTELKNVQMWYRRMKKLFALMAHCSENTVNEFLHEASPGEYDLYKNATPKPI
ncbi:uncharacterized protein MELLADRAFT_86303 [Melampsora larici-populina 98AG31]|uniref:Uncharacterized protein n=1 Tax=Melampsora larici-populina (strain 98AG31 / pathotype 3-4-7) TaxID=747676 RepID=F4RL94_MELLP|nr:uncharacterized protein MELLADRAFT_86303 [Melampsora larici-populina 98AG31]EGG06869.1 hypothetical protein MELLADRAFT_86303 [Melampsora larici-populina 98AG31]